jgi:flagellar biosynthetic protein FlhB
MAESEDGQEKKHEPGDKKWEEAAERGQTPRSADVSSAAVLLAGGAALAFGGAPIAKGVRDVFRYGMQGIPGGPIDAAWAGEALSVAVLGTATSLALPLSVVAIAALAANLLQTRMQLAPKALEPKIEKLNVLSGLKQTYFSWTPLVELGKGVGKVGAVAFAAYLAVGADAAELSTLALVTPGELVQVLVSLAWRLVAGAIPLIVAIAVGDYAYSWYRMNEQLKRTDQELKEDNKNAEGDPQMKARRKQRAREMLFNGSLKLVAEADVVITNPTPYAIALRYRRGQDIAPVVVAKGVDIGAARIRRAALEAGVPRVENRPLARALWRQAKASQPIPEDLYAPVAKVLAVVLARRRRR